MWLPFPFPSPPAWLNYVTDSLFPLFFPLETGRDEADSPSLSILPLGEGATSSPLHLSPPSNNSASPNEAKTVPPHGREECPLPLFGAPRTVLAFLGSFFSFPLFASNTVRFQKRPPFFSTVLPGEKSLHLSFPVASSGASDALAPPPNGAQQGLRPDGPFSGAVWDFFMTDTQNLSNLNPLPLPFFGSD